MINTKTKTSEKESDGWMLTVYISTTFKFACSTCPSRQLLSLGSTTADMLAGVVVIGGFAEVLVPFKPAIHLLTYVNAPLDDVLAILWSHVL